MSRWNCIWEELQFAGRMEFEGFLWHFVCGGRRLVQVQLLHDLLIRDGFGLDAEGRALLLQHHRIVVVGSWRWVPRVCLFGFELADRFFRALLESCDDVP